LFESYALSVVAEALGAGCRAGPFGTGGISFEKPIPDPQGVEVRPCLNAGEPLW